MLQIKVLRPCQQTVEVAGTSLPLMKDWPDSQADLAHTALGKCLKWWCPSMHKLCKTNLCWTGCSQNEVPSTPSKVPVLLDWQLYVRFMSELCSMSWWIQQESKQDSVVLLLPYVISQHSVAFAMITDSPSCSQMFSDVLIFLLQKSLDKRAHCLLFCLAWCSCEHLFWYAWQFAHFLVRCKLSASAPPV